jgi:hypothetical protein
MAEKNEPKTKRKLYYKLINKEVKRYKKKD